ncbi:conserved hypothetical protein [Methylocella tundrae]|uniref:DUF192 domain-containing protein n=1 Tax=Methylocella tundrae TaxID=227605 RepID=A0A8B6MBU0_METTU|nr:conserved hypothetical protein [Methylocella tundrae]
MPCRGIARSPRLSRAGRIARGWPDFRWSGLGRRAGRVLASALILTFLLVFATPQAEVLAGEAGAKIERLDIVTASGAHPFLVEVMRTESERERGLMFRRTLAADRGMLFDFETERPVQMWMKNTYLPLDMIFISRTGRVVGLAENTEPLSEAIISSGAPAYGVLEVNAGSAARIGLKIGDSVRHPLFGK